jgi:hypothetical protein
MKQPLFATCVLLLGLAVLSPCSGESFLLVGEERVDGIRQPLPLASTEGIMATVFESGQIIFDTGTLDVDVDWDARGFTEPLALAVEGRADFVMAAEIRSRLIAEDAGQKSFASRARYYLLDVAGSNLTGSGELELSNQGREEEMPYQELQYQLGKEIGLRLLRIWRAQNVRG